MANLRPGTQRLLDEPKKIQAAKRALATDLNGLLERELIRARQIAKKRAALAALEEKFFGSTPSKRQKRQVESLRAAIEELAQPGPLYTPDRFAQVSLSDYLLAFIRQNPQSHTRIRLNRLLLEAAYPDLIARSPGGVYPDREILIATPEDSQRCSTIIWRTPACPAQQLSRAKTCNWSARGTTSGSRFPARSPS